MLNAFTIDDFNTGGFLAGGTGFVVYQATPRLATQVGVLYGKGKLNEGQQHTLTGIPVQLRLGFSQPERRFKVDGVAEALFLHVERKELRYTYPNSPQPVTLPHQRGFNTLLSAGLGLRYALGQRLQLSSDLLGSTNPTPGLNSYFGFNIGFAASLGLRYQL